jgi:hypothetical protein
VRQSHCGACDAATKINKPAVTFQRFQCTAAIAARAGDRIRSHAPDNLKNKPFCFCRPHIAVFSALVLFNMESCELLISEARKRSALWNKLNNKYRDRLFCNKEWSVVTKKTHLDSKRKKIINK